MALFKFLAVTIGCECSVEVNYDSFCDLLEFVIAFYNRFDRCRPNKKRQNTAKTKSESTSPHAQPMNVLLPSLRHPRFHYRRDPLCRKLPQFRNVHKEISSFVSYRFVLPLGWKDELPEEVKAMDLSA